MVNPSQMAAVMHCEAENERKGEKHEAYRPALSNCIANGNLYRSKRSAAAGSHDALCYAVWHGTSHIQQSRWRYLLAL